MPMDLSGIRALAKTVNKFEDRVHALAGVGKELGAVVTKVGKQSFSNKADPYGESWPARSQPYKHKLMVKTGDLRSSLKTIVFDAEHFAVVSEGYGKWHHTGTSRMPRRSFLPTMAQGDAPYREGFRAVFVKFVARSLGL